MKMENNEFLSVSYEQFYKYHDRWGTFYFFKSLEMHFDESNNAELKVYFVFPFIFPFCNLIENSSWFESATTAYLLCPLLKFSIQL